MATTLTTNHGTFTGRTVETILRREYGAKARIHWTAGDSLIVQPRTGDAALVLAKIISFTGRCEEHERYDRQQADIAAFTVTAEGQAVWAAIDAELASL